MNIIFSNVCSEIQNFHRLHNFASVRPLVKAALALHIRQKASLKSTYEIFIMGIGEFTPKKLFFLMYVAALTLFFPEWGHKSLMIDIFVLQALT